MGDHSILQQIDATLEGLVERLDALDLDAFDVDSSDGKVTIECEDGTVFIVNRQGAADQIWLAEPRGGWHFDWDGGRWLCDKRGVELLETLEGLLAAKAGQDVPLR